MRYSPGKNNEFVTNVTYTYGKQYMLPTGVEYIGYIHTYKNTIFSGATHNSASVKLLKYSNSVDYKSYVKLKGVDKFGIPIPTAIYPTPDDYDKGTFIRYFVKQRNYTKIIEVDKQQYDSLKSNNSGLNDKLYIGTQLTWKITGFKFDVYKNGTIIHHGISDTNKRTVLLKDKELNGLKYYLLNYLQYSRITQFESINPYSEQITPTQYEIIQQQEKSTPIVENTFKEEPYPVVPVSNWILRTGIWDDLGEWIDTELWKDN